MEQQKQFFKQWLDFNKLAFNNTFNAVVMFQEQMEKMASAVLVQSSWMPEDGRKAIDEMIGTYKKGREDFKKVVDDGFEKVETFFAAGGEKL